MSIRYRPEIEGLRAVAVSLVVLCHAGVPGFAGGFIGVDVFFVLSGFLITLILLQDYRAGDFSLARFYNRRMKRILPALFLVLFCTVVPAVWLLQIPSELRQFGRSLIASVFFAANFFFSHTIDYFAQDAERIPLLHTWSLAVEEQFYLLYPLLFLGAFSTRLIWRVVAILALLSLAFSQWEAAHDAAAGYYLLQSRAWELMTGALAAFFVEQRQPSSGNGYALLGLLMVLAAGTVMIEAGPSTGMLALLPVGGAILILIYGSSGGIAGRCLTLKPVMFIGQISYSLYLWHQPVLVFWRVTHIGQPSPVDKVLLIGLATGLAIASWWWIERPFRRSRISTRAVVASAVAGALVLSIMAGLTVKYSASPARLSAPAKALMAATEWSRKCLLSGTDAIPVFPQPDCVFHPDGKERDIIVWGDSVASSLVPALVAQLPASARLTQITHAWCAPIADVVPGRVDAARGCTAFGREALDYVLNSRADTVLFSASWMEFMRSDYLVVNGGNVALEDGRRDSVVAEKLEQTIDRLQRSGKQVVLLYPTPYFGENTRDVLMIEQVQGHVVPEFEYPLVDFLSDTAQARGVLDAVSAAGLKRVMPQTVFCEGGPAAICNFAQDGIPDIADHIHYTRAGAEKISGELVPILSPTPP